MIEAGRFWVPGPTEVRPEILEVLRRPMIFHRNQEMEELMKRVTARLGSVFGTRRPVHVITGSGTSAMELAIRNGSVNRVLSIVHGDFGERFARMAEACGRSVTRLSAEPGSVVPLDEIERALRGGDFDTVTATHSETATGVLADMGGIARIVRNNSDAFLLVDAVSAAGATAIELDAWGLDAAVSASQKALGLPPGLAFAAVSERFVERARKMPGRGVYLDVLRYEEFAGKSQSPTTPAVSLLFALDMQLGEVEKETLSRRYARHTAMREATTDWVERADAEGLGISLLSRRGLFSPSVTCIRSDKSGDIRKKMREAGFELGGGQAPLTKNSFRIGHMGDHTVSGLQRMLTALGEVLRTSQGTGKG